MRKNPLGKRHPLAHNDGMGASSFLSPPATAELDTPLEAIVVDQPPVRIAYPYAPGGRSDLAVAAEIAARWQPPRRPEKTYVVPQRFGVGALLAIMTGMAGLFAFLRFLEAWPLVYLFFGTMALTICVVQMFWGDVPRLASVIAGMVWSVLFAVGAALYAALYEGESLWGVPIVAAFSAAFGAFGGYLMGTCAAGVFLVMEKVDPFLRRSHQESIVGGHPLTIAAGSADERPMP